MRNFGQRVRAARLEQGLSLRQLSQATGISFSQISRLERQRHAPRADDADRLAAALGTTAAALAHGELPPPAAPLPLVPGAQQDLIATYPVSRITRVPPGRITNISRIARAGSSWTAIVVRGKFRLSGPAIDAVVLPGAKLSRRVLTQHTVHAEALAASELLWVESDPAQQPSDQLARSPVAGGQVIGYCCGPPGDTTAGDMEHALRNAGCSVVYRDEVASGTLVRPHLIEAIEKASPGSTFVGPSLSKLRLRTHEVLELIAGLERRGVRFRTLDEFVDTRRPGTTDLVAALAEVEPNPRSSRVSAGTVAGKAGRTSSGRPAALTPQNIEEVRGLLNAGLSTGEIRERLGFTKSTVERYVRRIREGAL